MNFNERAEQILEEIRSSHIKQMSFLYETSLPFEEKYFREKLANICEVSGTGTGLSYEYYVERTSTAMARYIATLGVNIHPLVVELAEREFDFVTAENLADQQEWNKKNGFCIHHIEFGCCPAGCE